MVADMYEASLRTGEVAMKSYLNKALSIQDVPVTRALFKINLILHYV